MKMTGCSVPKCTNRSESGKSFYRIPSGRKDVRRRLIWLLRMGRRTAAPKNAKVCEDHFDPNQFESYQVEGRRKLKANAVPSLHLYPNSYFPDTQVLKTDKVALPVKVQSAMASNAVLLKQEADNVASLVAVHSAMVSNTMVSKPESCDVPQTETAKSHESCLTRENKLKLMLSVEQKRRQKAEKERDELRRLLSRVSTAGQTRTSEKGTMTGSSSQCPNCTSLYKNHPRLLLIRGRASQ